MQTPILQLYTFKIVCHFDIDIKQIYMRSVSTFKDFCYSLANIKDSETQQKIPKPNRKSPSVHF